MEPWFWLVYLGVGLFVGFLTGLLGIGGGTVIVPILSLIFAAKGFPADHVIHMALGTSLASIIIGSLSSARVHHLHGAVDWTLVKRLTPGIIVGTLGGAVFAHYVAVAFLKAFFVGLVIFVAFQMVFGIKAKPLRDTLPGPLGTALFGVLMGFVSSLAGIGGAVLTISFLVMCNVGMHRSIGTAAAAGIPIALAGTVGFITTGLMDANLPEGSIGYVYLPAWFGISIASFFIAPVGARLAHRMPVDTMKKIFMVFIVALAIKMAVSV